jgi:hypothetical protein
MHRNSWASLVSTLITFKTKKSEKLSWQSDAVPGGGAQISNRFSLKSRNNSDEFRPNLEEFRADGRNSNLFRGNSDLFRGNLNEI